MKLFNSLSSKITSAIVVVSLAGIVMATIFVQRQIRTAFDRFILDQNQVYMVSALLQYYRKQGDWEDVEVFIRRYKTGEALQILPRPEGNIRPFPDIFKFPFIIADAKRNVVYGRVDQVGQEVPRQALKDGAALEVDGKTVGWLLPSTTRLPFDKNSAESAFLRRIRATSVYAMVGTILLALILGGIVANSLTKPLREVSDATREIAKGNLGYQVEVSTEDEIGQLGEAFNQMSADLELAHQTRKQMTADIAHELRSPLSVILGYTEAMSDGKITSSSEVLDVMHQEAQHLNHLVEDLRTLSLVDSGEMAMTLGYYAPEELLDRTAAALGKQAEEKGIDLLVEAEPDLPTVHVDPDRIAQVLSNLVTNALRYTPEGGRIILSAARGEGSVHLKVADTGSGIAPEDIPHIFSRFYRSDKARQQNGESGLGLAIARSLVEAHGGELSVENKTVEGATFTIELPGA